MYLVNESKSSQQPTDAQFEEGKNVNFTPIQDSEKKPWLTKEKLQGIVLGGVVTTVGGSIIVGFTMPTTAGGTPGMMEIPYDKALSVDENLNRAKADIAAGHFDKFKIQQNGKWVPVPNITTPPVPAVPEPKPEVKPIASTAKEPKKDAGKGKTGKKSDEKLKAQLDQQKADIEKLNAEIEKLRKEKIAPVKPEPSLKNLPGTDQAKRDLAKTPETPTQKSDVKLPEHKWVKNSKDPHNNDEKIAKVVSDGKGGHYHYFAEYHKNHIKIWVDKDGKADWKTIKHTTPTETLKQTDKIYKTGLLGHHTEVFAGHDATDDLLKDNNNAPEGGNDKPAKADSEVTKADTDKENADKDKAAKLAPMKGLVASTNDNASEGDNKDLDPTHHDAHDLVH